MWSGVGSALGVVVRTAGQGRWGLGADTELVGFLGYSVDRHTVPLSRSIRWRRVCALMPVSTAWRRLAVFGSVSPVIDSASAVRVDLHRTSQCPQDSNSAATNSRLAGLNPPGVTPMTARPTNAKTLPDQQHRITRVVNRLDRAARMGGRGNLTLLRRGEADGVGNGCRVMLVVTDYFSCAQQPSWRRSRPHHDTGCHSCRDGNVDYDVGWHYHPQPGR